MKELTNIYKEVGQQFVNDLFKDYLLVTEKLSGSSFAFEKHGDQIQFFKGNSKMPINIVDRTLMMYYEPAIQYILKQTEGHIQDLPDHWRFCFQYFVHNQPGAIKYDNLPANNLILTHIQVKNAKGKIAKVIEDPRVLRDWASAFQVTPLIPIFSGYLKEEQKRKIREFLSTPREDQMEVFGTGSFAKYLIGCLNPTIDKTTLQNDLNKPIDSIIFKFFRPGTNQTFTAKMIDPYTQMLMKDKEPVDLRRAPADINEILLLDILAFIEERGLRAGELLTNTPQERYVELVNNLFNDYTSKRGTDLQKLDIQKADFAKGPEFDVNLDLIKNSRTKEILQKSDSLKNLYKIMLGSLRKKRNPKRIGAVMTASVIDDFNKMVSKISDSINKETSKEFTTFGEYLNNKVAEEVNHKDLEELVVEEKVLNYNKFINLGKVVIEANAEDQKFKNPETGRQVKVSSALGYDKDTPAYKKAKEIVGGKEPEEDAKKLKGLSRINDVIQKQINDVKDPDQKENAEKVLTAMETINDPNASDEDKQKLFGELVEDGIIKKNQSGSKFYVDTAKTGLYRKVLGDKSSPASIVNVAKDYGLDNIDKESANRIGKKQMTGAKLFGDKKSKTKVGVSEKGVSFDGVNYDKQEIPSTEKLEKIYGSKKEAEKAEAALNKYNAIVEQAQKSFKDQGEMETLSAFPDTPPTTPENRTKLKDGTADIIADGFKKQFGDKKPTKAQEKLMNDFKSLKDIKDPKEYDEKLMSATGAMMLDPYMKTGAADVVEMVSYMRELNKGNNVYMPAASNYPLGDIISISPEKIDYEKDSPEEIQKKIQLIMASVEARSIKKGAGGASASGEKTQLSEYKEFTNSKGQKIPPKETKDDLAKMSDKTKMYSGIFDGTAEDTKKTANEIKDLAKKYDFDLEDPEYVERKTKSINSAIAYVKKKDPDLDEDELRAKYEAYYDLGKAYANTYNETVKSQLFTNEVWGVDKKTGKATVDTTDGINSIAKLKFEFNIGFTKTGRPSNPVPTRFKNTKVEESNI
jgi:polyhydroxyalkanoate synthesis regulator phasin